MNNQRGFTLIELIVVIVILGILSAVAIPKYLDLRQEAKIARLEGLAGGISAASVMNYSGCQVGRPSQQIQNCTALRTNLENNNANVRILAGSQLNTGRLTGVRVNTGGGNNTDGTTFRCTLRDQTMATNGTVQFDVIAVSTSNCRVNAP